MKKIINKIKNKITKLFVMDSLFLMGLFIIAITNFAINLYFGLYFLGLVLIAFSVFLFMFGGDK